MHDLPRQKLCELLAKHGHGLCDDAKKLEGLLKDVLRNEHKRETFVLISALPEGVAHELRSSKSGMPPAALAAKLARQLCDNLALDEAAAQWSVESWALALGIEITSPKAVPVKRVGSVNMTGATPVPSVDVDLAALAMQHRENARQDQVKALDAAIQDAVHKGRLRFLRSQVQELLKLQPRRDDMRRLLEVLPDESDLPREFTNSIGMRFVLIEPGEFMMGSNEANDEKPPHLVAITQPFYLGVYPVTQAEYQAVMGTNPSRFTGNARLPVEQVSWNDAAACAQKLSQLSAELSRELTYRLPTEAEWEYACRAGSTGKWCFGNQESQLGDYAWFVGNSRSRTHPVGEKKPNAWGLHDMHGNVWEWCQDCYHGAAYKGRSAISQDPFVESSSNRVIRGGSWNNDAAPCRSARRRTSDPTFRSDTFGFRLALSSVK